MKNVQEQDYSKFQVLNQTCLRYSTTVPWRQHSAFADFYDQFVLRMTNIRLLRLQQAQETKGLTLNKAALRRDLCEVTLFVADAMVAFAFKTKDTELGARAKVTCTPILYGKQDDARTIAQNIHDLAVAARSDWRWPPSASRRKSWRSCRRPSTISPMRSRSREARLRARKA